MRIQKLVELRFRNNFVLKYDMTIQSQKHLVTLINLIKSKFSKFTGNQASNA